MHFILVCLRLVSSLNSRNFNCIFPSKAIFYLLTFHLRFLISKNMIMRLTVCLCDYSSDDDRRQVSLILSSYICAETGETQVLCSPSNTCTHPVFHYKWYLQIWVFSWSSLPNLEHISVPHSFIGPAVKWKIIIHIFYADYHVFHSWYWLCRMRMPTKQLVCYTLIPGCDFVDSLIYVNVVGQ